MAAPHFDHDYVAESMERLSALPADAKPAWGRMTPAELPSHLAGLVLYSMGRNGSIQVRSNWVQRNVLKHLLIAGLMRIPKNIKASDKVAEYIAPPKTYDVESLHALLEEYLGLILADDLEPPPHPVLGPFTVDEWASFHCRHFEHHFRQFGI